MRKILIYLFAFNFLLNVVGIIFIHSLIKQEEQEVKL